MNENQETKCHDLDLIMTGWNLSNDLKKKYPDARFNVSTEARKFRDRITIRWNGSPTIREVKKTAKPYGQFTGVTIRRDRFAYCEREPISAPIPKTIQTKLCSKNGGERYETENSRQQKSV